LNVGAMAWSAYMLITSLPCLADQHVNHDEHLITSSSTSFARSGSYAGPILWGASFPLALAAVARRGEDPGRLVGGVYAANTVGAIFGSVVASLVLVYWFGSQRAQQVLMIVSGMSGLLLLAPAELGSAPGKRALRWVAPAALVVALGLAAFLIRTVDDSRNPCHMDDMRRRAGAGGDIFTSAKGSAVIRRFPFRQSELPQRGQGAGVEACRHAPSACWGTSPRCAEVAKGAGHRAQRRRRPARGENRQNVGTSSSPKSSRCAASRVGTFPQHNSTSSAIRGRTSSSTMRGIFC
jgi:hypothetical protein